MPRVDSPFQHRLPMALIASTVDAPPSPARGVAMNFRRCFGLQWPIDIR
jgi:hypothetical protein